MSVTDSTYWISKAISCTRHNDVDLISGILNILAWDIQIQLSAGLKSWSWNKAHSSGVWIHIWYILFYFVISLRWLVTLNNHTWSVICLKLKRNIHSFGYVSSCSFVYIVHASSVHLSSSQILHWCMGTR